MDAFLPALEAAKGVAPTAKNIARLAAQYGELAAAWAFTQWSLRKRAKSKFDAADEMFFTKNGLEQATHEAIAMYHASRFPKGELVGDLTCGIGADTIALARRGQTIGFEIDPETAWCARKNVRGPVQILQQDCLGAEWDFGYAFADPSRRVGSARTLDSNAFSPNPMALAERLRDLKLAAMKLSPMLSDDTLAALSPEIEFVSYGGECREALAWFGNKNGEVSARKVETGAVLRRGQIFAKSAAPSTYLLVADPAAIRAHCLSALCADHGAVLLGDSNGYLTAEESANSEWLMTYRVVECGRFDEKRIRRSLTRLGGGTPIIKARGVRIDVAKLGKSLSSPGSQNAIVVLYPVGKSVRYLIVEALQDGSEAG